MKLYDRFAFTAPARRTEDGKLIPARTSFKGSAAKVRALKRERAEARNSLNRLYTSGHYRDIARRHPTTTLTGDFLRSIGEERLAERIEEARAAAGQ